MKVQIFLKTYDCGSVPFLFSVTFSLTPCTVVCMHFVENRYITAIFILLSLENTEHKLNYFWTTEVLMVGQVMNSLFSLQSVNEDGVKIKSICP